MVTISVITIGILWCQQNNFVGADQQFLVTPVNKTVIEGEDVTLRCRVEQLLGGLQWTFNDFGLGLNRSLPGYDRYTMLGSDDSGTWDLHIEDVRPADEGLYQCQILASSRSPPLRSDYAQLRVVSRPQPPILTSGPEFVVREDSNGLVQCISKGSRPAAEIVWRLRGEVVEDTETRVTTLDDLRTMTVSTLTLPGNTDLNNQMLSCAASNPDLHLSESVVTRIIIDPEQKISVSVDTDPLYEGDNFVVTCDTRDSGDEVIWTIGGQLIRNQRSASLSLKATRDLDNSVVSCQTASKNSIKANLQLNINCEN